MASDFGDFMMALMQEKPFDLQWKEAAMLGVVVASEGYPGDVEKGNALPELSNIDLPVFHAGTKLVDHKFVGNGGRVLLVAAEADSLKEAQEKVYAELAKKEWTNFFITLISLFVLFDCCKYTTNFN